MWAWFAPVPLGVVVGRDGCDGCGDLAVYSRRCGSTGHPGGGCSYANTPDTDTMPLPMCPDGTYGMDYRGGVRCFLVRWGGVWGNEVAGHEELERDGRCEGWEDQQKSAFAVNHTKKRPAGLIIRLAVFLASSCRLPSFSAALRPYALPGERRPFATTPAPAHCADAVHAIPRDEPLRHRQRPV